MGVTGGERTANFTVSIVTGTPPAAATNLQCSASSMFVTDDGSDPAAITISAIVYDQYFVEFDGATVLFSSTLGTPSPPSDVSAGGGLASSSLDLTPGDVSTHPTDSFTITAKINSGNGVVSCPIVVTIDRVADSEASSVVLNATSATTIFEDSGTETVDLDALVRDQFAMPLDGVIVDFGFGANGSPGTISPSSEETGAGGTNADATGHATATFSATEANIEAFPDDQFTITAKVVTSGGTVSAVPLTINISRTVLPALIANFTASSTSPTDNDFTDTSTGTPTAWRWDFDNDGSVDSTAQNPTNVDFTPFGGAGDYMVKLTVLRDGDGASDTVIKAFTVVP